MLRNAPESGIYYRRIIRFIERIKNIYSNKIHASVFVSLIALLIILFGPFKGNFNYT